MATETTNLGLNIDGEDDFYDIERVNRNWEKIDAAVADASEMKTAGGTGTAITLSIPSLAAYKANQKFSFIASANNSGASTTINVNGLGAKSLFKVNTTTAPKLVAGKAYEVWYNGTSFFLKASAEGNAIAAEVLAGKTFSNDDDTGIVGTIPSKGAATITPGTANQTIAAGQYLSGAQTIEGDAELVASNIKAGANIFGVDGVYEGENPLKTWKNKTALKTATLSSQATASRVGANGKGWILAVSAKDQNDYYKIKIDGEYVIGTATQAMPLPYFTTQIIMLRFESSFLIESQNSNFLLGVSYLLGDDYEKSVPKFYPPSGGTVVWPKLNVAGSGWIYGLSKNFSASMAKLIVDGNLVFHTEFRSNTPMFVRFNEGFQFEEGSDSIILSYVLD